MTELGVAWFRRDLRVHDNPMLHAAASGPVVGLFVLDPRITSGPRASRNRNAFLAASLRELRESIRGLGSELHVREGLPEVVVPEFAEEVGAATVHASRDYTPFARARDERVAAALAGRDVTFGMHPGTLIAEPGDVTKEDGKAYRVFTPFWRRWQRQARRQVTMAPRRLGRPDGEYVAGELPLRGDEQFQATAGEMLPAGEAAARERLDAWVKDGLAAYGDRRDLLAETGTSRLSQDLHFGLLSPLQVVERAEAAGVKAQKFVSEVAWREFFHQVAWHFPHAMSGPFQEQFDRVAWRDDPEGLSAWKQGETGYPVVDAAMRELAATGYMHNRARMITASFLAKDLLIDWREGETHFLRHLLDGDIANNNGGWQWAASTGTDAAPYFRIFNPILQGKRFDPGGDYVRRWIPALEHVPTRYVHSPWEMPGGEQRRTRCVIGKHYPGPIIDHGFARERAINAFAAARDGNE